MGRILIEYNPTLSIASQNLIKDNITASMTSNDDSSNQYDIDMVAECLTENNFQVDLTLIEQLRNEGVNYIEI
jgi:hypothetical protein